MEGLKVRRRQRKAAITRHLGTLDRLVAEEDIDGVNARLDLMHMSFAEFETAHDEFHNRLTEADELEESETWFGEVEADYIAGVRSARAWLKVQRDTPKGNVEDLGQRFQSDILSLMNIPKVELEKFNGNPVDYQRFITIFDEVVDSKFDDWNIKLTRLLQYTTGEAKSSIKNCILIGGEDGYKQARETLKARYGNSHLVTQRIINDLKSEKRVIKAHELQQLADELATAVTTLRQLKMYEELSTQQNIITIVRRCPQYVQSRWKRKALETKSEHDKYPTFDDFVSFMKLISSEACDPVYGSFVKRAESSQTVLSALSVLSSRPSFSKNFVQRPCVVCGQSHRLFYCDTFKSLSPKSRLDVAVRNKLCFNCLLAGHNSRNCRKVSVCSVPGCGKKHTKFIHIEDNLNKNFNEPHVEETGEPLHGGTVGVNNLSSNTNFYQVYLPILPIVVNGKEVFALLDSGSTNSFITQRLAKQLNLKGRKVNYEMNTLNRQGCVDSELFSFVVKSMDGEYSTRMDNVIAVKIIPVRYPKWEIDLEKYEHLSDLPLHRAPLSSQVEILIGMDNAFALMPYEVRCNKKDRNQPYAVRTLFGWSLCGPVDASSGLHVDSMCIDIDMQIRKLWEMETLEDDITAFSCEDRKVIDLWNKEVTFENGHYILPIPWRERPMFPDNKIMAIIRLKNLVSKLMKNGLINQYSEGLLKMVQEGYAERVPEEDLSIKDGTVWYLPHHGVVSETKPGKLRIVFDCAAKLHGVSLNNQCLSGPDLNNKLVHVLLRFRQYKYAITADVEAMYHQVKIPLKDRNFLRFLWMEDNSIVEYRMTSHLFGGVWCASSSTFALRRAADDFASDDTVRKTIYKSFYVDDLLVSVDNCSTAMKMVKDTKQVLQMAGFKLGKFVANDVHLLQDMSLEGVTSEVKDITPSLDSKALGVRWDVMQDVFYFVSKIVLWQGEVTKRRMLGQLSSIYDPLGLLSPIIVRGRMLFQAATRLKLSWDAPLPIGLSERWINWISSLGRVSEIKFARCIIPDDFIHGAMELHVFCDASEAGYGACSYVRIINETGKIHVILLASKARLAPIKRITIPRLELSAAVIAARLESLIRRELDLPLLESTYWTDSQIYLAYIQNEERRFKPFVANRVAIIRECSDPKRWRYISGHDNPADVLSRGCDVTLLPDSWIKGPLILHEYRSTWSTAYPAIPSLENDVELKQREIPVVAQTCIHNNMSETLLHPLDILMNYFSCFHRLAKGICWILRVKSNLFKKGACISGPISVEELREAKTMLVKHVQERVYEREISLLRKGKSVTKSSSIYKLSPMLKDDIMVVGGRLKHASISVQSKNPIILPGNHRISVLIVQHFHYIAHLGIEWTLSYVRREYWITRVRGLIKRVKRNCMTCKRLYGSTMHQKMSDLPPERCTSGEPPFSSVGVDLFGPFLVKQGRSEVKRYGCVYTCFSIRAIHIEVLNSLETDSFINGFMRFAARRGFPTKVWSDNGTNLVGARAELSRSLRQLDRSKVVQAALRKDVDWNFNPPLASHQGGIWERMIRTIRRILMYLMTRCNRVTDEILQTVFCEVEGIVNSRPITKCSQDVEDDLPLTPNHLLLLRDNSSLSCGTFDGDDGYRKHWRQVQHLAALFWKRWTREYLLELQRRVKWQEKGPELEVGNLVLVMDENIPRGLWPLGLVLETNKGRDGLVRSARVRTKSNQLIRPITKLVMLEGSD